MESKSLTNELITAFDMNSEMPSTSAFVQSDIRLSRRLLKLYLMAFHYNLSIIIKLIFAFLLWMVLMYR